MNQRLHKNSIDAVYIIDIKSHQNKAFTNLPQLIILYLLICIGPTQALAKGFKHVLSRSTYKLLPIYPLSERLCSLSCPCLLIDTVQIMRAVLRNRPGNQCDFIERRPIGFAIEIVLCRIHNFLKLLVSVWNCQRMFDLAKQLRSICCHHYKIVNGISKMLRLQLNAINRSLKNGWKAIY